MNTINYCPSLLIEGFSTYSPRAAKILFDETSVNHILGFDSPQSKPVDLKSVGRLSLSGAQPKFGLVLSEGALRYAEEGEQSQYILKPRPIGYHIINHDYCAANEHLTMQLARQVYGIETAANAMIWFADGQAAYLTRRYDVHAKGKYAQEDFATLLGYTRANGGDDYKYDCGSYEECACVIRNHVKAYMPDLLRFFQVVVFNFITLNDDAHLKNFTLLSNGKEYRLAPAYDLVNTSLQIYEPRLFALNKGLFREGMYLTDTRPVRYADFVEFGRRIGLPESLVRKELDRFIAPNSVADMLIARSFLSQDLKESYLTGYHYRQLLLRP